MFDDSYSAYSLYQWIEPDSVRDLAAWFFGNIPVYCKAALGLFMPNDKRKSQLRQTSN